MELLEQLTTLIEDGRDDGRDISVPGARETLVRLLGYAERQGGLAVEGAWRLDGEVAAELGDETGYIPPGGWRGVAALAAGCGVLKATRQGFEPSIDREELADWSTRKAGSRLVESFTRRLVPPTTAAGLFILLGLHPAWGVHLAHTRNRAAPGREAASDPDREMFPEATLEVVEQTVFGAINAIIGGLRRLEPGHSYGVDALANLVDAACRASRCAARRRHGDVFEGSVAGLPPFVDTPGGGENSNWRVIDFTTGDLLDAFLVPAGAARRFDDGRFSVVPGAFEDIQVGSWEIDRQHEALNLLLGADGDCKVA